MRIIFLLLYVVCLYSIPTAQNLIKNPSFEDYYNCPFDLIPGTNQNNKCYIKNNILKNWTDPTKCTSDFIHQCSLGQEPGPNVALFPCGVPENVFGFQIPKSGLGYAGILTYNNSDY